MSHKLDVARQILARMERRQTEWEEMADACHRRGFSPEFCFHGAYLWVDHDCACYLCETDAVDQWTPRGELMRYALAYAPEQIRADAEDRHSMRMDVHVALAILRTAQQRGELTDELAAYEWRIVAGRRMPWRD